MTDSQFDQCMEQMQQGNNEPLKEIYNDYIGYIYSCIYSVIKSKENAEDLTADFFLKLWDNADKYRPGTGHKAWMSRIAHNMSIDFLRKHNRETLTDEMGDTADDDHASTNAKSIYDTNVSSPVEDEVVSNLSLNQALTMLSEDERIVINMKIMGDMTFRDIAAVLNQSMGTTTWKYQSALKKLRKYGYE